MVRLMKINELDEVLGLALEKDQDELKEALPHLNVYVLDDAGIKGAVYILDGYIIGDILLAQGVEGDVVSKQLVEHVKTRYDELLIHVKESDDDLKKLLETLGFESEGALEDEPSYLAFSWMD